MTNLETNETKMNSSPIHYEHRCKNLSKESKKLGAAGSGL